MDLVKTHLQDIYMRGISLRMFERMLTFVAKNYYIHFNGDTYLQIKGIPMGAHFSPIAAIIFMHFIEQKALEICQISDIPIYNFVRYVDDIIIFTDNKKGRIQQIHDIFNGVNKDIKFTIETPDDTEYLTFLDMRFAIINGEFIYKWYIKDFHSGNMVHYNSHVADISKTNFIRTRMEVLRRRNNNTELFNESVKTLFQLLVVNNYPVEYILNNMCFHKNNTNTGKNNFLERNKNKIFVKTPAYEFYNIKLYNKKAEELNLPFSFVPEKMPIWSSQTVKTKSFNPCPAPDLCFFDKHVQKNGACSTARVVYNFKCLTCNKIIEDKVIENKVNYIGGTTCPLRKRFNQHRNSIHNGNDKSALTVHLLEQHFDEYHLVKQFINNPKQWDDDFEDAIELYDDRNDAYIFWFFQLEIRDKLPTDTLVWIAETTHIEMEQPHINRKQEDGFLFYARKKADFLAKYIRKV